MESSKTFSQLHHRIPAVLDNEQLVEVWLNDMVYKKYYIKYEFNLI